MKRKLRKSLSWLLTVAMVFSLFCGMIPTASAAAYERTVYEESEIKIALRADFTGSDSVEFRIVVDGSEPEVVTITDVPRGATTIDISAEGFTYTFETDGCTVTAGNILTLGTKDSHVVTINLASEKTSDAIPVTNNQDGTNYGTFHWMKHNAGNSAYQRELTVYVNGEEAYVQTINTPKDLTNGGANRQFWFVPNTELYISDYTMDPSITLNQATTNRDISVYLTTRCMCGLDSCLCPGGCDCLQNCPCDACQGATLGDGQINTGYGIITYLPDDDGYNLTVQVYVNGELASETDPIKVQNNRAGNLKFQPKDGYFYQARNGYDLDADYDEAWWAPTSGNIYFGTGHKAYQSVLKIYLWTFENQVALDVERAPTIADEVTGYILTYDAFDPETNAYKTYTFTVTNFLAAQTPYFPTGADVTIEAICREGFEVTDWSTSAVNAELTGGGNTAHLRYDVSSSPQIIVYMNSVGPVEKPTDDELHTLLDQKIQVACTTESVGHTSENYALDISSITVRPDAVTGNALNDYAYTITINSSGYVSAYNTTTGKTHTPAEATANVTLGYVDNQWTVLDGQPVTFAVACESVVEPAIKTFDKDLVESAAEVPAGLTAADYDFPVSGTVTVPVNDEVTLLYKLTVTGKPGANYDITDADAELESGSLSGTLDADGNAVVYVTKTFAVGDFTKNDKLVNSATITTTTGGGVAPGEEEAKDETDAEEGAPVPPTDEELGGLFGEGTDGAVTIHCTTAETSFNHVERTYGLLDGYTMTGTLGSGTVESPWYVTITVTPDAYVDQYERDNGNKEHTLNPGQEEYKNITLNWDREQKAWVVASEVPVVYTVTCDDETIAHSAEFHIVDLADIKQAVADRLDNYTGDVNDIKIYTIAVTGTKSIGNAEVGTTTGGAVTDYWGAAADQGHYLARNVYDKTYNVWIVENVAPIIDDDTITAITIYYKIGDEEGHVDVGYQGFEEVKRLDDWNNLYITQIKLKVSSDEPEVPDEPAPPTDAEITDPNGILADAVKLDCSTEGHDEALYDIAKNTAGKNDSYTIGAVEGSAEAGYTCTITVNAVGSYLTQYNGNHSSTSGHSYADGTQSGTITLKWNSADKKWEVQAGSPVTFNVTCNNQGGTTDPTKPDDDQIPGILGADDAILVDCVSKDVDHGDFNDKIYDLWPNSDGMTRYEVTDAVLENGTWTCTVTILPDVYVSTYSRGTGTTHWLSPATQTQTIKLTAAYDEVTGEWTWNAPADHTGPWATFAVACVPEKPDDDEIPGIVDPNPDDETDALIRVNCVYEDAVHELLTKNYELWANDANGDGITRYEVDGPIWNGDTWTCTVTFNGETYVERYSEEPGVGAHILASDQEAQTVVLTWDSETQEWTAAVDLTKPIASFDVTCADNVIYIEPAAITVYTGGNGYSDVVGSGAEGDEEETVDGQESNGLPEPGFYITLPEELDAELKAKASEEDIVSGALDLSEYLKFTYSNGGVERTWGLERYDTNVGNTSQVSSDGVSRFIYRILPAETEEGEIPIRLQFTDETGAVTTSDNFTIGIDTLYKEYSMTIYPGALEQNRVQVTIEGQAYPVVVGKATLTVRGTVNDDITTPVENTAPSNADKIIAVADADTKYFINDSDLEVNDEAKVSLLVDELAEDSTSLETLKGKAITANNAITAGHTFDFQYLDLVDANNGNAYLTLDEENGNAVTIYWPIPEDADTSKSIYVVHYDGLDRDYDDLNPELKDANIVVYSEGNGLSKDGNGNLVFKTSTFSPFALVYETKDSSTDPDPTPDPGPGDSDDDDDHYTGGSHNNDDSDPTGNLSIELDVNGGDDSFTFTVYLTDKDGDDLKNTFYFNGDFTGTIGSGDEITLESGEKIVIRNLPEGTRYEVIIETADGYTYVIDGEEGVIHTGMNEAEFTATRTVPVADPSVTGVSRWLNVTDHIAYLTGYPGGAFGPDNSMTRAEVAQMFYALLNNKNVTITKTFPDVPANAWYATAVNTLASLGMVSGDANGNYRPNDPITRAEFCVIALAFAYEPDNAVCYFSDVSRSDWFYTYVAQAASYGWIGGYTNGNFGPNDRITRAQVTTIVNNMLGRAADRDYVIDHQNTLVQFNDLTRAHWAYFQIMEATNAHDYTKSNGEENWR